MSILNRAYEISVWQEDFGEGGKLVEKKLGIIGTDGMQSQSRVLEPTLSKNINGTKKLTFKMYRHYVDIMTGEKVENPFIANGWMISERKIKLKYKNKWYDFIIKDISENSSNYLYTYSLEEAYVQELAKNGFGVTLDTELMNNLGTAECLAEEVLKDTDWNVASEKFVQEVEENLVYLTATNIVAKNLIDIDLTNGVSGGLTETITDDVLAFYSCCKDKPPRFQFIWPITNLEKDSHRIITNKGRQYYIDLKEEDYETEAASGLGLYLPKGFQPKAIAETVGANGVYLSSEYRGKRYGFAQQTKFVPALNRHVKLYNKKINETFEQKDGKRVVYYGYDETKYASPALTTNIINNASFESTTGWTGTHSGEGGNQKAVIETVYGYFNDDREFVNVIDELNAGTLDLSNEDITYTSYLKMTFPSANAMVVNSGPYDNRTLIGNMTTGDKYALKYEVLDSKGVTTDDLTFSLQECEYDTVTFGYKESADAKLGFTDFGTAKGDSSGYKFSIVSYKNTDGIGYSESEFKKNSSVRLCIKPPSTLASKTVYYLKNIQLFEAIYTAGGVLIPLEEQGTGLQDRVLDKAYYFFPESALANVTKPEDLKGYEKSKKIDYGKYVPVYNEGAEKVRSINVKESNYFNILQTIAETFGAWVDIDVSHNDEGEVTQKTIRLKNYIGNTNYSGFRYGVNLKDIQRAYASKNIVTKLMVKQNSNEYAEGGFCTIARAGANPNGDTSIYDFQYYHNRGLLDARKYLDDAYTSNGYFPTLRDLNKELQDKSELLAQTNQDLTRYKAEKEAAEAGLMAATAGIEETEKEYEQLTGFNITAMPTINGIQLDNERIEEDEGEEEKGGHITYDTEYGLSSVVVAKEKINGVWKIFITANVPNPTASDKNVWIVAYPKLEIGKNIITQKTTVKCTIERGETSGVGESIVLAINPDRSDVKKLQTSYVQYLKKEKDFSAQVADANNSIGTLQTKYNNLSNIIDSLKQDKTNLNKNFFQKYGRFIQEGTWISEEYVDDNKYYADALSVMYNSCYPQVAYQINVVALTGAQDILGVDTDYSAFSVDVGDKTYVEDTEFFGSNQKEEVTITELSENLDDPSKDLIKVQNFKTQFQDLFQKITATVQQTQYSTGAYEKAVALAEANQERKNQFMTDAMGAANARLTAAGQQSVTWGNDGITVKSVNSPNDAIRMVGGAILLSKQDENGQQKWVTGVTSDGVSASLITAGVLNAGQISIMNADEPVFRWDAYGISAYDYDEYNSEIGSVISGINTKKFVRFDKHGLYGVNNSGVDGANWHPQNAEEIERNATFGLTWEGLKVTNSNGVTLRIGDNAKTGQGNTNLLDVRAKGGESIISITEDGSFVWGDGPAPTRALYKKDITGQNDKPTNGGDWSDYADSDAEGADEISEYKWHKVKTVDDYYVSYSYDGCKTWGDPIQIQGRDGIIGGDAINCYIESSMGTFFEEDSVGEDAKTFLTAKIYQGTQEIDKDGQSLTYTWYVDDKKMAWPGEKKVEVQLKPLFGKVVTFKAS